MEMSIDAIYIDLCIYIYIYIDDEIDFFKQNLFWG
jgi:hypothetical protein